MRSSSSNRLLRKSHYVLFVMLNLFQHLIQSISYETLKQSMKQIQDKVQGDRKRLFQQPGNCSTNQVNPGNSFHD
jgi:hypothetical protein